MPEPKALTARSLAEQWQAVKDPEQWWEDTQDTLRDTLQELLDDALECELVEQLHAHWYERNPDRVDYRNGSYGRDLVTRLGVIRDLRVPRSRHGTYQTDILPRYQRYEEGVTSLVQDTFLAGASTRRVGEVFAPLFGEPVSAATVSRLTKRLDDSVAAFQKRRLADDIIYLFLDGVWVSIRGADKVQKKPVLVAYGLTASGQRVLLDFRVKDAESEQAWEGFLNSLYQRGLEGHALRLVITDGNPGLHKALETVYPDAHRQRCWVHKLRNVSAKLPARRRTVCLRELRPVYTAATYSAAREHYQKWATKWEKTDLAAVACVRKDIDELLTFYQEPVLRHVLLRTTNRIERIFREVRRRTRPMGCFVNEDSAERMIYAVFSYEAAKWQDHPLPDFTHNT